MALHRSTQRPPHDRHPHDRRRRQAPSLRHLDVLAARVQADPRSVIAGVPARQLLDHAREYETVVQRHALAPSCCIVAAIYRSRALAGLPAPSMFDVGQILEDLLPPSTPAECVAPPIL
ncbi:hypothetical protein Gbro_4915 (plasmid) [Gordonia bronchialis DSM 43247]|uniref:Uncharacterized protein n=1 Tax=Gordonia bronchialis (strain ATCC 25592 / DSM 43247 / BCRC 13721 / JCM 3198 / KCTC 3076 / NBRC 16047 / NCTC 10667) TaxID=526226 RepID=D0LFH9_GORB4|nr:hypothetical protein Gbro_4915 [Gordonia bronchialis DSM 43247]STS10810.1 Uncharacterised protein [Gordonia bronchialis]